MGKSCQTNLKSLVTQLESKMADVRHFGSVFLSNHKKVISDNWMFLFRDATKKDIFLMVGPLRGGKVKDRPLERNNLFLSSKKN